MLPPFTVNDYLPLIIAVPMIVYALWRHFFGRDAWVRTSADISGGEGLSEDRKHILLEGELEIFIQQLEQVVAWTELLMKDYDGDSRNVFRKISPVMNGVEVFKDINFFPLHATNEDMRTLLATAMAVRQVAPASPTTLHGQILTLETNVSLICGSAEVESNGYIDVFDLPPIDTWFYLSSSSGHGNLILYCWVPDQFMELARKAQRVEMTDNFGWLEESDPALMATITARLQSRWQDLTP